MYDAVIGEQTYAVFTFSQRQSGGKTYTLKNEAGAPVFTCTPANDFQYLIVSSPNLTAGNYTLWQGNTQLQGSKGTGGMGGRPNMQPDGAFPEPPEGMNDPNATRPAPPDGFGDPNGTHPTAPEGMDMPNGRPGGMGGFPGGNQGTMQEASTVFQITEGSNHFQIAG